MAQTWPDVANIRIRCKGTIGGNIMARDPAYDFALAALAANARLHFLAADGAMRIVPTAQPGGDLQDGLLTAITLPSGCTLHLVFDRSLRPIVSLALGLDVVDGRVTGGRVAIGCAYPRRGCEPALGRTTVARRTGVPAEQLAQEVVAACPNRSPITRPARATDGA